MDTTMMEYLHDRTLLSYALGDLLLLCAYSMLLVPLAAIAAILSYRVAGLLAYYRTGSFIHVASYLPWTMEALELLSTASMFICLWIFGEHCIRYYGFYSQMPFFALAVAPLVVVNIIAGNLGAVFAVEFLGSGIASGRFFDIDFVDVTSLEPLLITRNFAKKAYKVIVQTWTDIIEYVRVTARRQLRQRRAVEQQPAADTASVKEQQCSTSTSNPTPTEDKLRLRAVNGTKSV